MRDGENGQRTTKVAVAQLLSEKGLLITECPLLLFTFLLSVVWKNLLITQPAG